MELEGPLARAAREALRTHEREQETSRHESREKHVKEVVEHYQNLYEVDVYEVNVLDKNGTTLEFCIEGHGANPKVVARIKYDYSGGLNGRPYFTTHLRVRHSFFDRWVKHPFSDFPNWKYTPNHEVHFNSLISLGRELERSWSLLRVPWCDGVWVELG
jgi:hypothetical protein